MNVRLRLVCLLGGVWGMVGAAVAGPPDSLFRALNDYRTNGQATCGDARMNAAAPLVFDKRLIKAARLLAKGKPADAAFQAAKFQGGTASILQVSGRNADEALANAAHDFCETLLRPSHTHAGIAFHKGRWWIVLSSESDAPTRVAPVSPTSVAPTKEGGSLEERLIRYRAAGDRQCNGGMKAASAFKSDRKLQLATRLLAEGRPIDAALESADLTVDRYAYYSVSAADAERTFEWLRSKICQTALDPQFTHIETLGTSQVTWLLFTSDVLAEAVPVAPKPAQQRDHMLKMLTLVNEARSNPRTCGNKGSFPPVTPLKWNDKLAQSARLHSEDMARRDFFAHVSPDGVTPARRIEQQGYVAFATGENIAVGHQTVEQVVEGWLNSPGHCANIMGALFTEFGAGYARPTFKGQTLWTQHFGDPR